MARKYAWKFVKSGSDVLYQCSRLSHDEIGFRCRLVKVSRKFQERKHVYRPCWGVIDCIAVILVTWSLSDICFTDPLFCRDFEFDKWKAILSH